jgi:hypothetical protein
MFRLGHPRLCLGRFTTSLRRQPLHLGKTQLSEFKSGSLIVVMQDARNVEKSSSSMILSHVLEQDSYQRRFLEPNPVTTTATMRERFLGNVQHYSQFSTTGKGIIDLLASISTWIRMTTWVYLLIHGSLSYWWTRR